MSQDTMPVDVEFDPAVVAQIVAQALTEHRILPFTFIETSIFERLNELLAHYVSPSDVVWIISELRSHFLSGFTKFTSTSLHEVIYNCIKCPQAQHPPVMPMWNTVDPDLMIIAENPAALGEKTKDLIAGLKIAGFSSARCCLTYVTRCNPLTTIDDVMIKNCIPYLHTEIAVLNPKLILTLGMGSYSALVGDDTTKLSSIQGTIVWFGPYAVLVDRSLLSGMFTQEKNGKTEFYLSPTLETAYRFLYGGH